MSNDDADIYFYFDHTRLVKSYAKAQRTFEVTKAVYMHMMDWRGAICWMVMVPRE